MAIEIGPIAKPQIWLIGNNLTETGRWGTFSGRVDHAQHLNPTTTDTIGSISNYDETDILTFDDRVRVIITTKVSPRSVYTTQSQTLGPLEFEGDNKYAVNVTGEVSDIDKNKYAETYYTLNGKDPVRTKAYLYKYLDMNDADYDGSEILNETELGFTLSANLTGNYLVTLKAKTYQYGNDSNIAIAKFKIAIPQGSIVFENLENDTP